MKKFYLFFISIIFCFLMISCSNLYQDFSTTTVEFTKESIASIKSRASGDDENYVIFATVTCGKKTQTKTVDITEVPDANGVTLQFDKLPVGKTGTLYVSVGSKKIESNIIPEFYSENIADLDVETQFTVQPNGNTKIKVSLNPATKYSAYFTTFAEIQNEATVISPQLTFTENSTITAPLPVGTTRWSIRETSIDNSPGQLIGSFGEKIDVKNELMKYREKFFEIENKNLIQVYFDATGNPMNQINTPIVYCEAGQNTETDVPYKYKILGSNTLVLPTTSEIKDYCFDNAGNFYFVTSDGVFKIAYNHKENKYEDFEENSIEITDVQLSSYDNAQISYDKAQNYLYVYGSQITPAASASTYIHRIQNPAGEIYKNTIVVPESFWTEDPLVQEPNIDIFGSISFTVHNGILYVSKIQRTAQDDFDMENSYSLVLQKGSIKSGTFEAPIEYKILSDAQNGLSGTTDIMFQDGSLYIIFSCSNKTWGSTSENYSIGGIVKYDTESEQFDDSFRIKGFVDTSNTITDIGINNLAVNYYAPTSGNNGTESKYFYGPKQFVAIMPKKLVFLDSGADVSSYNADNKSNIPSKSRIVEYDLSTNSFSSKEITGTDLGFNFSGDNISFF